MFLRLRPARRFLLVRSLGLHWRRFRLVRLFRLRLGLLFPLRPQHSVLLEFLPGSRPFLLRAPRRLQRRFRCRRRRLGRFLLLARRSLLRSLLRAWRPGLLVFHRWLLAWLPGRFPRLLPGLPAPFLGTTSGMALAMMMTAQMTGMTVPSPLKLTTRGLILMVMMHLMKGASRSLLPGLVRCRSLNCRRRLMRSLGV